MSCQEYARSLINNLSLQSGLILLPTKQQFNQICDCLGRLNIRFDDASMISLIHGNIGNNAQYLELKKLILSIKVKTQPEPEPEPKVQGPSPSPSRKK